jgi:hypothetical protein
MVGQFKKLTHHQNQRLAIRFCELRAFRQMFIAAPSAAILRAGSASDEFLYRDKHSPVGKKASISSAFYPLAFAQVQKDKPWRALAGQPARKAEPAPDVSQQEISH